ncbi:hypothetical protein AB0G83_07630 [Streptomyces klenkii]|uniref:hypothetical protein n=1 Tax=Streptomyces klenkii TaxID=1420899 RepID=UPI00340B4E5F
MADVTRRIAWVEGGRGEAFTLSGHPGRHALISAVNAEPVEDASVLTITTGACLTEITTGRHFYFEAVITDLATDECLDDLDYALAARGCPGWRGAIVDMASSRRAHPYFPGSNSIQYLIIHPEAA